MFYRNAKGFTALLISSGIAIIALSALIVVLAARNGTVRTVIQTVQTAPSPSAQLAQQPLLAASKVPNWEPIKSNEKGYPIFAVNNRDLTLKIYSFNSKQTKDTGLHVYNGGEAGRGNAGAIVSPNLLFTAYVDRTNGNIAILSNQTLQSSFVTKGGTYITAWSPDSSKFIYYVSDYEPGMGGPEKVIYDPTIEPGFYLFILATGEKRKLFPLKYVEGFIDNDRLLTRNQEKYGDEQLVVFNLKTFEEDPTFIKDKFGFGSNQFHFSSDSKKWAFLFTPGGKTENGTKVIYATFPNLQGTEVETGGWADNQWPLISPNGTMIAWQKRVGYVEQGVPDTRVAIYNVSTKEKRTLQQIGRPMAWIDDTHLIAWELGPGRDDYYLVDIAADTATKLN